MTVLYRLFDDQHCLLYVGVAEDTKRRWCHHRCSQFWWSEVREDLTVTEEFPDRITAEAAEVLAIRNEQPRYNIQHAEECHPYFCPCGGSRCRAEHRRRRKEWRRAKYGLSDFPVGIAPS